MMRLLVIFLLLALSSCFFMGPSPRKRLQKVKDTGPVDVAIVPGLPLEQGQWDTLLKTRMLWSEFLIRRGYARHVLYSGNAVYTPWVEGPTMALIARQLGIDSAKILVDTLAEHSTENLYYGYQMARAKGFRTIAIATDPFQCAMLHKFARRHFEEEIWFLPVVYDSILDSRAIELRIDTSLTKRKGFVSLKERQGYGKRMKGTMGRGIKH